MKLRPWNRREDPADLERRLVWMVGSPRSGSTWLLNLIAQQPGFVKVDEPLIGLHLGLFLHELFGSPAANFASDAAQVSQVRADNPDYFFADAYADVWRPRLRELVLARFAAHLERAGDPAATCVIKEPNGSQAAPVLVETLPGSRLLWLLRDGRDVVDSELDGISPGGWLGEYDATWEMPPEARHQWIENRAYTWLRRTEATQSAYEVLPEEQRMLVRYEDLRADTAPWLERIHDWLGGRTEPGAAAAAASLLAFEDLPEDQRGRGKFARSASPGAWEANLSDTEQEIVHRVMGAKLRELGYEA